jgi:hypothetical protein
LLSVKAPFWSDTLWSFWTVVVESPSGVLCWVVVVAELELDASWANAAPDTSASEAALISHDFIIFLSLRDGGSPRESLTATVDRRAVPHPQPLKPPVGCVLATARGGD